MAFLFRSSFIAIMALIWFSLSSYIKASAQYSGTATFYNPPYIPSTCYGFVDQGFMIAVASDAIWNNGATCGQVYQVNCLSGMSADTPFACLGRGTVVVKIVEFWPPGSCRGTFGLSQEAFASIAFADPNSSAINISYQQV